MLPPGLPLPLLPLSSLPLPLALLLPDNIIAVLDRHTLGHVVDLVHADEARGELKHVVAQGDDDELGVFGAFFDVVRDDGDLCVRG